MRASCLPSSSWVPSFPPELSAFALMTTTHGGQDQRKRRHLGAARLPIANARALPYGRPGADAAMRRRPRGLGLTGRGAPLSRGARTNRQEATMNEFEGQSVLIT